MYRFNPGYPSGELSPPLAALTERGRYRREPEEVLSVTVLAGDAPCRLPRRGTQAEELVTDKILSDLLSYVNRYSDKLRLSNSSTSSPKSLRAALTGSGVLMSTPAIFKREIGSVLHPPERKRL